MKRRDFVKLSALVLFTTACQRLISNGGSGNRDETIIVIGAGMAGLGAARKLHDAGYTVKVLEGRGRIGGRVWTSRVWDKIPVDLGASWIHGTRNNPLTEMAKEAGIGTVPTDYNNDFLYDTDGTPASDALIAEMERLVGQVQDEAESEAEEGMSLLGSLNAAPSWEVLSDRQRQLVLHTMNTTIEHEFAGGLNKIDALNPDDADEFYGNDFIFPDGYSRLVEYIARDLDIQLEQVVEQVSYENDGVVVKTNKGQFSADRAVVTLPIGVLKNDSVKFAPPLSSEKQKAIQTMGAGVLDKLFLRFPFVFWDQEAEILNWISAEHGRWNEWLNISYYKSQPVLLGFNAADYARKIDSWSDEEIVADAMRVLRTIYGTDIPEPDGWQLSRWARDPFALCAYSFNAVGASTKTRHTLAESVTDKLYFAGEATSSRYPATVHGAYLSGLDLASEIMDQQQTAHNSVLAYLNGTFT